MTSQSESSTGLIDCLRILQSGPDSPKSQSRKENVTSENVTSIPTFININEHLLDICKQ